MSGVAVQHIQLNRAELKYKTWPMDNSGVVLGRERIILYTVVSNISLLTTDINSDHF